MSKFGSRRKMLITFILAKQLISRRAKSGDDISGDLVRDERQKRILLGGVVFPISVSRNFRAFDECTNA